MFDLKSALSAVVAKEGSDLHLKVPSAPMMRLHGALTPIEGFEPLTASDTEGAVRLLMADDAKKAEFDRRGEADFAYELPGQGRFRINAFRQRGLVSLVCRVIPTQIPTIEQLSLPEAIKGLAEQERGIVLCTGTTGSGKSTTLAAMISHINTNFAKHVVTIEDPIEYLHTDKLSIVNQREIGSDTGSFPQALRRVLRQDPDAILIGEMRDEETVRTALTAAETGHLVLSTLHTVDATETANRIIDFFPPHEQQHARAMLAGTLKGVVSQRLVPTLDGTGRAAACEILLTTGRVRDALLNPQQEGSNLSDIITEGSYYGMQTFDQALLTLYQQQRISLEDAVRASSRPNDFKLMVASEGKRATSI